MKTRLLPPDTRAALKAALRSVRDRTCDQSAGVYTGEVTVHYVRTRRGIVRTESTTEGRTVSERLVARVQAKVD